MDSNDRSCSTLLLRFFFLSLFWAFVQTAIQAQSLIVGIPNAEATEKGAISITHESQLGVFRPRFTYNTFNFITFGVGFHTELALSVVGVNYPYERNTAVAFGFKSALPLFAKRVPKWELKGTLGMMTLFSTNRQDMGGWGYGHFSFRIPVAKTRITAGISYGSEHMFGFTETGRKVQPVSFMGGIEQPVVKWLSLVCDWMSGNHALAAAIPALQFNVKKHAIITGVKVPTSRLAGDVAWIVEGMIHIGPFKRKPKARKLGAEPYELVPATPPKERPGNEGH